jgi:hypothetical protein
VERTLITLTGFFRNNEYISANGKSSTPNKYQRKNEWFLLAAIIAGI